MEEAPRKQNSILIEVVDNGFIVKEDYSFNHHNHIAPTIKSKKVFNTKKQLFNYISENL